MTKTNDVTTDGINGFSMYFNKFTIYSKLVNETSMRKKQTVVMRRTTSDHFWLYGMKRRCMKLIYDI